MAAGISLFLISETPAETLAMGRTEAMEATLSSLETSVLVSPFLGALDLRGRRMRRSL
jgi:hypothetical protein